MSSELSNITPARFNKQFLASKTPLKAIFLINWKTIPIGEYQFYIHPNQEVTYLEKNQRTALLIGSMYDYRNPEFSNSDILKKLLEENTDIIGEIAQLSGEFVLAFKSAEKLWVLNDAGALMELYYSTDYAIFGSQVKLISEAYKLHIDTRPEAVRFYNSAAFKDRKFYVSNKTEYENMLHLKPNYLLDLTNKVCERFYPDIKIEKLATVDIAKRMSTMLVGYLKSVSNRKRIAVPITAGWDSRILLAAALKANISDIEFYVVQHDWMGADRPDVVVAKKIAKTLNLELSIITYENDIPEKANQIFDESLDHNRAQSNVSIYNTYYKEFGARGVTIINGNVSEVARAYYPNLIKLTGKDLARIYGYPNIEYVENTYNEWIDANIVVFESHNLNIMDMFYWDERVGNWVAKMKSAFMLFSDHFSPFNSRILLQTALSSKRQDRDAYFNTIYREILNILSPELLKLPINPGPKSAIIKFMKKTRVYPIYQNIGIKLGLLTFK